MFYFESNYYDTITNLKFSLPSCDGDVTLINYYLNLKGQLWALYRVERQHSAPNDSRVDSNNCVAILGPYCVLRSSLTRAIFSRSLVLRSSLTCAVQQSRIRSTCVLRCAVRVSTPVLGAVSLTARSTWPWIIQFESNLK